MVFHCLVRMSKKRLNKSSSGALKLGLHGKKSSRSKPVNGRAPTNESGWRSANAIIE